MTSKKRRFLCGFFVVTFLLAVGLILNSLNRYHIKVPIKLGGMNTPEIKVKIDNKELFFELDLGSKFPCSLSQDVLDNITEKQVNGNGEWKDIKGNKYQAPSYLVPKIQIGALGLKQVTIQEKGPDWFTNTTIWEDNEQKGIQPILGSIGRPLLQQKSFLLDYQKSQWILSNDKKKLKAEGYDVDTYLKIPFEIGKIGITIPIKTDRGITRLAIDTGCSLNLIKSTFFETYQNPQEKPGLPLYTTHSFIVGENDLGPTDLYLYDITPELDEIDGFLGTPFLMKHVVYIDFANNILYISPKPLQETSLFK